MTIDDDYRQGRRSSVSINGRFRLQDAFLRLIPENYDGLGQAKRNAAAGNHR
jgi:hypothetical protein